MPIKKQCPVCGYDDSMTNKITVEDTDTVVSIPVGIGNKKIKNLYWDVEKQEIVIEFED